jgi:antitoxin (DNA-binding transcriptional repressor) of toxin-antitoxin stability system
VKIQSIGAFEAKTRLSELLDKVQRGQVFCITKRGTPVAELRAPDSSGSSRSASAPVSLTRRFSALREKVRPGPSARELITSGRR